MVLVLLHRLCGLLEVVLVLLRRLQEVLGGIGAVVGLRLLLTVPYETAGPVALSVPSRVRVVPASSPLRGTTGAWRGAMLGTEKGCGMEGWCMVCEVVVGTGCGIG